MPQPETADPAASSELQDGNGEGSEPPESSCENPDGDPPKGMGKQSGQNDGASRSPVGGGDDNGRQDAGRGRRPGASGDGREHTRGKGPSGGGGADGSAEGDCLDTHADHSSSRRRSRYQSGRKRRYSLRETVWDITKKRRHAHCGRVRIDSDEPVGVQVEQGDEGAVGSFSNIQTCGSPWACPVCAAKKRQERADEIARVAAKHLSNGGGLAYWTGTLRHYEGQALSELWDAMKSGWSNGVINGSSWQRDREEYGVIDYVQSPDVTIGPNGWHPHMPVLLFLKSPLSDDERRELQKRMYERWARAVEREGLERPYRQNCPLEAVKDDEAVSRYLSRAVLKDGGVDVGFELQRHDKKRASDRPGGRRRHMTPFQLLGELHQWPEDRKEDGEPSWQLRRWWEYEEATTDRKSVHWSGGVNGLRDEVQAEMEKEDEEEPDPVEVAKIGPRTYQEMVRTSGALSGLLECVEGTREEDPADYIERFRQKSYRREPEMRVYPRR